MAMTRKEFEVKAARDAEKRLGIPPGWWGTYLGIFGPRGESVRFSGRCWIVRVNKRLWSKHDSRAYAIKVARSAFSTLRR